MIHKNYFCIIQCAYLYHGMIHFQCLHVTYVGSNALNFSMIQWYNLYYSMIHIMIEKQWWYISFIGYMIVWLNLYFIYNWLSIMTWYITYDSMIHIKARSYYVWWQDTKSIMLSLKPYSSVIASLWRQVRSERGKVSRYEVHRYEVTSEHGRSGQ